MVTKKRYQYPRWFIFRIRRVMVFLFNIEIYFFERDAKFNSAIERINNDVISIFSTMNMGTGDIIQRLQSLDLSNHTSNQKMFMRNQRMYRDIIEVLEETSTQDQKDIIQAIRNDRWYGEKD